jgi:hypothetical protein
MLPTASRLLEQALALSDEERTELVIRLLDSIGGAPTANQGDDGAAIEAAWITEARQRLSELDAGEMTATPWGEARLRTFAPKP